jgi:hypothetical protein
MATVTKFAPVLPARDVHPHADSAGGPWLFLAAPISFALTLLCVIFLSRIGF